MKCKDGCSYFNKNQKYRSLETEKKNQFFVSEIPNFYYMGFFRKCSMFLQSIPLKFLLESLDICVVKRYLLLT